MDSLKISFGLGRWANVFKKRERIKKIIKNPLKFNVKYVGFRVGIIEVTRMEWHFKKKNGDYEYYLKLYTIQQCTLSALIYSIQLLLLT